MIDANNPALESWVEVPENSDFPIQNLPFGIFRTPTNPAPRMCTRIGDFVVDLAVMNYLSLFEDLEIDNDVFTASYLNDFIQLGKTKTRALRNRLSNLLQKGNEEISNLSWHFLHPIDKVEMLLPIKVGDYTDFYSSIEHATNVGCLFRDPENALLPNWKHLPVGYHGRASSIVASGTPITRPNGQTRPNSEEPPVFGPSKLLDFELEMAFIVGRETKLGQSVSTTEAEDYIFGMLLFNDWSARDIQSWEYVPLGPFLGKSFASTVSPWIVTLDALDPFRVEGPVQDPAVLPYLQYEGKHNFDIALEVEIKPEKGAGKVVSQSNFKFLYWNICQQLAHHTSNGCNLNVGDLCASGTISGKDVNSYGSMLEITWRGTKPVQMPDGSLRKFLHDGDTVIMRGHCAKNGVRIGFGEAVGTILAAH
ncbi:MAG: fumarylacetoacetase [Saprospiraceae bacterium]|nr:fumarylacetoacetase [Saprospiraceae bacterium]